LGWRKIYVKKNKTEDGKMTDNITGFLELVIIEIQDIELRKLTFNIIKKYTDILTELPASVSGKYHIGETAEQHALRVVWFVKHIIKEFNLPQEDKDVLISSAILHDIGNCVVTTKEKINDEQTKYPTGWYRSINGAKLHPIISMYVIGREALNMNVVTNPLIAKVALIVSSHMSHWITECPKPVSRLAEFLALADYFASRSEIKINGDVRQ
jgi:response regulator RpfG family c-di-GMP phosphodiesterase